jgi:two-component system sensor histidine kinase AlgZ
MSGQFSVLSGQVGKEPLEVFCRPGAVLAVVLAGEGVAVLLALAPGVEGERWVRLGLLSLLVQWVALMWVAGLCVARRSLGRYAALRVAWVAVLWLVVVSVTVGALAFGFLANSGVRLGEVAWFVGHVAVIAAVVGLLGVLGFYAFWQAQGWALRAREAELASLHARIRPHFLFNTLNSIASLIPTRPKEAEAMVVDFAGLLRGSLAGARLVPLAEELALVRGYLAIEAVRLEGRLRVVWSGEVSDDGCVDDVEALQQVMLPSLSVQPLVENAVRYGVEPLREGGEVWIDISRAGDEVVVTVRNALVAVGARREGAGMALANVRARLEGLFAKGGRLDVVREEGMFVVRLVVPRGA